MSATEKVKHTINHYNMIDWKDVGKKLGKSPARCRERCVLVVKSIFSSERWNVDEIERLYKASALFKNNKID